MKETTKYYVVKEKAVPEVLLKVVEAKRLMETRKAYTIQEAVDMAGISRSSFYKYKPSPSVSFFGSFAASLFYWLPKTAYCLPCITSRSRMVRLMVLSTHFLSALQSGAASSFLSPSPVSRCITTCGGSVSMQSHKSSAYSSGSSVRKTPF